MKINEIAAVVSCDPCFPLGVGTAFDSWSWCMPSAIEASSAAHPVLIVDDDAFSRELLRDELAASGFAVVVAHDGSEALALFRRLKPVVVVSDLHMPGMRGLELLRRIQDIDPEAAVVLISGYASLATVVEAMKAGARDFLVKPVAAESLVAAVRAAR